MKPGANTRQRLDRYCRQNPRRRHPLDDAELEDGLNVMAIVLGIVVGLAVAVFLAWGGPA
jgi:hypothetical protein